ncbi:hypothetical protein BC829DRAFT_401604 [Chytridium lagenaria]|nr:hypothetical protein BC829DRAFT_401604 [Chytridium lagenaria]
MGRVGVIVAMASKPARAAAANVLVGSVGLPLATLTVSAGLLSSAGEITLSLVFSAAGAVVSVESLTAFENLALRNARRTRLSWSFSCKVPSEAHKAFPFSFFLPMTDQVSTVSWVMVLETNKAL